MAPPVGRVRLELELDLGADPISGAVALPGEPGRPFVGWVAFVNALDEALGHAGSGSPEGD